MVNYKPGGAWLTGSEGMGLTGGVNLWSPDPKPSTVSINIIHDEGPGDVDL
jgi:hypothetical protein